MHKILLMLTPALLVVGIIGLEAVEPPQTGDKSGPPAKKAVPGMLPPGRLKKPAIPRTPAEAKRRAEFAQRLTEAGRALATERYRDAANGYAQALKLRPNNTAVQAFHETGLALADGKVSAGGAQRTQFVFLMAMGKAATAYKRHDVAAQLYSRAVKLQPGNNWATGALKELSLLRTQEFARLMATGKAALASKHYADAKRAFGQALRLQPGNAAAAHGLKGAGIGQGLPSHMVPLPPTTNMKKGPPQKGPPYWPPDPPPPSPLPPSPPPAPPAVAPARILHTAYKNPPGVKSQYVLGTPGQFTWTSQIGGNNSGTYPFSAPYEWVQIIDPANQSDNPPVVVEGMVISPGLSNSDMPFSHPFGFDWECFIYADAQYRVLLGPNNAKGEHMDALARAMFFKSLQPPPPENPWPPYKLDSKKYFESKSGGNPGARPVHQPPTTEMKKGPPYDPPPIPPPSGPPPGYFDGVLGVETDAGIIPPDYQPQEGDRVVLFGRWIVDDGHPDFGTEIHPPLMLVSGRAGMVGTSKDETRTKIISRPFLVGQTYKGDDRPFLDHMLWQLPQFATLGGFDARPNILPPFQGVQQLSFIVKPPTGRNSPHDRLLASYHFTVRSGIQVQISPVFPDAVQVQVRMDASQYQMRLPPSNTVNWSAEDLENDKLHGQEPPFLSADWFEWELLLPLIALAGINTDSYANGDNPLPATSPHDSENVVTDQPIPSLTVLPAGVSVDDNQYYPIYGYINLRWERHP